MTSWTSPDKVLVLRSLASGSRIEINFRSYWGNQLAGDLVIQSLVGCQQYRCLAPDTIRVPQYPYQAVEVVVQLRGQRLTIAMDGKQLHDDSPLATDGDGGTRGLPADAGSVGFGVLRFLRSYSTGWWPTGALPTVFLSTRSICTTVRS